MARGMWGFSRVRLGKAQPARKGFSRKDAKAPREWTWGIQFHPLPEPLKTVSPKQSMDMSDEHETLLAPLRLGAMSFTKLQVDIPRFQRPLL